MNSKITLVFIIVASQLVAQQKNKDFDLSILKNFQKVRDFTINATNLEAYFTIQSPKEELSGIFKSVNKNGHWQTPELASFSGEYKDLEPYLSPDGLRLYFASNRPLLKTEVKIKDFDIWYVERSTIHDSWSEPVNMGVTINTKYNEFYPAIAKSKNIYFTSDRPAAKGKDDIFFSEYSNQGYKQVISLSSAINTEGYEFNAYIAPDESFLIFTGYGRKDGLGSGDLYISYKTKEDNWTVAKNMGNAINSDQMDYCPFVHWNSKTMYFTSRKSSVQASDKLSTKSFMQAITSYSNGLSRIYKEDISILLDNLRTE